MSIPVGLNVWSRLVDATFPYLDRTAAPFDSLWQVVRVSLLIAENEREIERVKARPETRPLTDIRVIGTPDQVTETMLAILTRGARQFTVNFADVPHAEGTWLFAATVLPHLRAA